MIHLGYRPFYNVSLSNLQTYRTISGIPTTTAWTPPWASQYTTKTVDTTYEYSGGSDGSFTYQDYANTEIVILQADGFRDKYVDIPTGVKADIERLVSQGETHNFSEDIGDYYDTATVNYTQDKSALVDRTVYATPWDPAHIAWYGFDHDYVGLVDDADNSPARWAVAYRDSGTRHYSINDGRTGGSEIYEPQIPVWNGGSLVTSNDRNGVWSIAPASYYSTTSTVATQSVVTGSTSDVGTNPFAHFIPSRITQEVSYGSYTYYDTSDWRFWNWGWRTVYYPIYRDRFDHGFWIQSSIYETFTNFISNWTSKKQDIKDQRQELSFQLVTKPQENYDQRPKFETKESTTKVVQNKSVTQWKTENITENQTLIVTTREWQDNGTGLQAEFTQPSILADGNVNIASGHDVTIEAFVRSAGTDQTVSVIAGRDVVLNGFVPDGSDSTTLAAVAVLAADGAVIVTAGRDVAFDEFSS
ncbi:MAG: hypothetical protein ACK5A3_07845, partial [Planctomyces sp.]